jgi:hypothetical protein
MFFSDATQTGFITWPFERDETQGYIMQQTNGKIDLRPHAHVYEDRLPADVKRWPGKIIGTFHSHPDGCRGNSCYYQPPSVQDLESLRALAKGSLNLTFHIIVTAKKLFLIESSSDHSAKSQAAFDNLVYRVTQLKDADHSPAVQESRWMRIAGEYPNLITVATLPIA